MTAALGMVTGSLPPTATYARRDWVWFPAAPGTHPDDRDGSLTVLLQKGKRGGAKPEVDTYGVQEERDRDDLPPGVRSFLLRNDTDASQRDVYRCAVGADAGGEVWDRCTCRAGEMKQECKHVCCLRALIEEGLFDAA